MKTASACVAAALVVLLSACKTAPRPAPAFDWPALRAAWRARVERTLAAGGVPIFDVESHYDYDLEKHILLSAPPRPLGEVEAEMDRHGVAVAAFSPGRARVDYPKDVERWSAMNRLLAADHAERFLPVPLAGRINDPRMRSPESAAAFERILADGYPLMGEYFFRHYISGVQYLKLEAGYDLRTLSRIYDMDAPLDSPFGHALFRFSQEHRIPFVLHYEVEDRLLPVLEKMLGLYPGAEVIWAHFSRARIPQEARRYTPAYVDALLAAHPNLYFDLSSIGANISYPPGRGNNTALIWNAEKRELDPEWMGLIEKYPWRFMAALDYGSDRMDAQHTLGAIEFQRLLLDQLSETARPIVAYRAAWKLVFREEAPLAPPGSGHRFDWEGLKRGWRARLDAVQSTGVLPLIDVESNYAMRGFDPVAFGRDMDRGGVALIAMSPQWGPGDPDAEKWPQSMRDLMAAAPSYYIPVTAAGRLGESAQSGLEYLHRVFRRVGNAGYPMMGEFFFRHYPSHRQFLQGGEVRRLWDLNVPIDGPAGRELFAYSQAHHVPFQIHYEVEDGLLPALETMLDQYPGAVVVWAHFGRVRYAARGRRYTPAYVRRLLEAHPNLYFDTSCVGLDDVYPGSGEHSSRLWDRGAKTLLPEWRKLMAEHPWRFLSALDLAPDRMDEFDKKVAGQRFLLAQLPPDAREVVAYKAAWKLLFHEELP